MVIILEGLGLGQLPWGPGSGGIGVGVWPPGPRYFLKPEALNPKPQTRGPKPPEAGEDLFLGSV